MLLLREVESFSITEQPKQGLSVPTEVAKYLCCEVKCELEWASCNSLWPGRYVCIANHHPWHLLLTLLLSESLLLMLLINVDDNPTLAVVTPQQLGFQNASSTHCFICAICIVIIIMALGALLLKKRLTGKNARQGLT